MSYPQPKTANLLLAYFEQQKQLYGDGYILPNEQWVLLKRTLKNENKINGGSQPSSGTAEYEMSLENGTENLREFYLKIKDCQKCPLGKSRKNFVFGAGNPNADVMLVGEAPGAEEDRLGKPFVGRAGQLLNKILDSIHFKREDVFIANILKCRPPNNRDPLATEVEQCEPYLHEQIRIIRPKLILAMGRIAGQTLLKTKSSLTNLRGKLHSYQGIHMIVTYHPAALLRNPQWKYPTWDDVRYLRRVYDGILNGENPDTIEFRKGAK